MTIEKGAPWGTPGSLPDDAVVVGSDAAAREVVEAARRAGEPVPPIGLTGGDLWRTLGGQGRLAVGFPVDLGAVLVDGRLHWFVAHLVARDRWWGRVFAALNAQWRGAWNLAPKGHPNDGRLDTLDATLGWADRLKVRSRLPQGAHLPHPRITARRVPAVQVEFAKPLRVELDGADAGSAHRLSVRIEPDALTVHV